MTKLEGKYLEKMNDERILIERLEKEIDFLKSEIQYKNNLLSCMLRNMDNSKANFQHVVDEDIGGECKNKTRSYTDKTYEWGQVIPRRLGLNRTSMAKKPANEFDWHASYDDFSPRSNKFDLLSSLDLHDTGDYICTKSSAKSQMPTQSTEEKTGVINTDLGQASPKKRDHPRVIDHNKRSSTAAVYYNP
eukprot:Seg181.8 transcript_id=Seg181.8/GoldUCD/mRNA.D3Y31 product="hypothetical protein" protein_id=Seg181.8/GoldUCD/D3Y31